jgi:xanthine dehydrogenase YagT iron-sulfur-binding subunit
MFAQKASHISACKSTIVVVERSSDGPDKKADQLTQDLSRRKFVNETATLAGLAMSLPLGTLSTSKSDVAFTNLQLVISLEVNDKQYSVAIDPRTTLLDLLRERLGLTGTKKGCDRGQCGACTVLANGRRVNSCLTLAATQEGSKITTVEGLAHSGRLHPMQESFLEHDAFQCGYCTPGQICSAIALLDEWKRGEASIRSAGVEPQVKEVLSKDEIRERMSGNLCRCGAYGNIVAAIQAAHERGIRS